MLAGLGLGAGASGRVPTLVTGVFYSAIGIVLATVLVNFGSGVESLRAIFSNVVDEANATKRLLDMLERRSLDPVDFFNYGNAYPASGYAVVRTLEWLGYAQSMPLVSISLRLVSALCAFVTAVLTYGTARNLGVEKGFALAAAVGCVAVRQVLYYGILIHPDVMQMMFCTAVLFFVSRGSDPKHVVLAAVSAGLAAATKYGGLVFLGAIGLLLALDLLRADHAGSRLRRAVRAGGAWLGCLVLALGVLVLVNVHGLWHIAGFVEDFRFELAHMGRGHEGVSDPNPLHWLPIMGAHFGGLFCAVLFIGTSSAAVLSARRAFVSRFEDLQATRVLVFSGLLLVALAQLLLQVRVRAPRYLIPLTPLAVILTSWSLEQAAMRWRASARAALSLIAALLTLACALDGATYEQLKRARLGRYGGEEYAFADLLVERVPLEARILADRYVYVPEEFPKVRGTTAPTRDGVERYRPGIIVISRNGTGRHVWPRTGTRVRDRDWLLGRLDATPGVVEDLNWLLSSKERGKKKKGKKEGKQSLRYEPVFESARFIVLADPNTAKRWKSFD